MAALLHLWRTSPAVQSGSRALNGFSITTVCKEAAAHIWFVISRTQFHGISLLYWSIIWFMLCFLSLMSCTNTPVAGFVSRNVVCTSVKGPLDGSVCRDAQPGFQAASPLSKDRLAGYQLSCRFFWRFRESLSTSSGPSSSSSTTWRTSPLPCRCTTSRHAPLDKVGGEAACVLILTESDSL